MNPWLRKVEWVFQYLTAVELGLIPGLSESQTGALSRRRGGGISGGLGQGRQVLLQLLTPPTVCAPLAEEGIGAGTELRSPCECESLVEFQGRTLGTLESLSQKHILWVRGRGLEGRRRDPREPRRLP